MVRPESIWDSLRLEMGEDSFLLNLLLCAGQGVRFLPHCHATSFLPDTWLGYLEQQSRWKRSHLGNRSDILFNLSAWAGWQVFLWPLEVFELFTRGEHLGVCMATVIFSMVLGRPLHRLQQKFLSEGDAGGDVQYPWNTPSSCSLAIFLTLWAALAIYASVAAGVPVMQQPRLHRTMIFLSFACMALQLGVAFGFWHVHKIACFWVLLLSVPIGTYLVRLPHGMPRPWGGLVLPLLGGLCTGVENVLCPVVGVANLDATNGNWGTRQLAVDLETSSVDCITALRRQKRICLAALWFGVNCGMGALILLSGKAPVVLHVLLALTIVHALVNLLLALGYSVWLKFCSVGYGGVASTKRLDGTMTADCLDTNAVLSLLLP